MSREADNPKKRPDTSSRNGDIKALASDWLALLETDQADSEADHRRRTNALRIEIRLPPIAI
jgi:hypothetical protein